MLDKVIGWTRPGFIEAYAQSLRADCDLHPEPSDMVLVCDTSSYNDEHFCQTFFQIPSCITKLWVGHKHVSLKSMQKYKCGM